jgi:type IVB pilus formation R64 PilN family outer membrane protein
MNLSWRWNSDRIEIFRYETKMFKINALAGTTDVNTTLDTTSTSSVASSGAGGGGQQGNEGSSGQRTTIASNFDLWTDVTNVLKGILSDKGTLTIASSAGTISVRDTPMVLSQVEAQVREFNRIYSRQVKLNVEVYAVENSASDNYGTDFQLAWGQAAGKYGIEYSNNGTGSTGTGPGLSAVINTGPFAGSRAIVQALTSIGNTTLLTSGSVSSLNGQSVPMNVSTEQAYLQSYSTTLTSGDAGNSTTTLTPGVVTGGFSMHFTPHVLEDSKVMLRYSIDLSSVDNIATFEAPDGNSAIQLPTRSVRNFMQNVNVKSGQTLVLTGFQQTSDNTNNSGPFSSKAWFLGGKKNATKSTKTIVIVVTPYIVE